MRAPSIRIDRLSLTLVLFSLAGCRSRPLTYADGAAPDLLLVDSSPGTTPSITPIIGVTISPTIATLEVGAALQLTATVLAANAIQAVTWSSDCGSVDGNGLYTAPATVPSSSCHVVVTSLADSTKTATAAVTIGPPPVASIAISPTTATLEINTTQQLTATVLPANAPQAVTWSTDCGAVDANGLYTAPASVPSGPCQVVVTSVADGSKRASATITISVPSLASCTPQGWCWDLPTPVGTSWASVWVANDHEAWAVGEGGLAYHYLNGTWSFVPTGTPAALLSVYGFAPNDVWAAGAGGGIHWDGTKWSPAGVSPDGEVTVALWGTAPANVWAGDVAANNQDSAEADSFDGTSWKLHFTDCFSGISSIWGASANDVWFTCSDGNFQHYDGSLIQTATNVAPSLKPRQGLWGTAANSVWALGKSQLLHFDGTSWTLASTLPAAPGSLWGTSDSDFWGLAGNTALHFSSGTTWTQQALPASARALHGSSASNIWAVGGLDTILHYDGTSWTRVAGATTPSPLPVGLGAIWASAPNDAWIVGATTLSHWDGVQLTVVVSSLPHYLSSIQGASATDIWAAGGTLVLHYDGHAWSEHEEGLDGAQLWSVWPIGNGEAYGTDGSSEVYHYTPAAGWAAVYKAPNGPYGPGLSGLWSTGPNDVWAGSYNGIARWNGSTWMPLTGTGAPKSADLIFGSGPNDVYVYFSDTVHHFNGTSWTTINELSGRFVHNVSVSGPSDVWLLDYYELSYAVCRASHWDGASWSSFDVPVQRCGGIAAAGSHLVYVTADGNQLIHLQH